MRIVSSLADRVRGMVGPRAPVEANDYAPSPGMAPVERPLDLSALEGVWRDRCFVVERQFRETGTAGRHVNLGEAAAHLRTAAGEAGLFTGAASTPPPCTPFVFVDLETTGLNGGAGTHAFLFGCGRFEEDVFVTRQFVLARLADERPMLDAVSAELRDAGAIVTFNGKSFDAPVLETRYLFNRLDWWGVQVPHIDVLHAARRFWGSRSSMSGRGDGEAGCSLMFLERHIIGTHRADDVPGFEVPSRYFQFIRTGDARPLVKVLEHNRQDLVSLAVLTSELFKMARIGPDAARTAREALALGRLYADHGMTLRARSAFATALTLSAQSSRSCARADLLELHATRIEALRALAMAWRRERNHDEAANCWRELAGTSECPAHIRSEATEALAIHNEHRLKDLENAQRFARAALHEGASVRRVDAVKWRLSRLERKLILRREVALRFQFEEA